MNANALVLSSSEDPNTVNDCQSLRENIFVSLRSPLAASFT